MLVMGVVGSAGRPFHWMSFGVAGGFACAGQP